MLPQKLRNYFHHIVKIAPEEDGLENLCSYFRLLANWKNIIVEKKAEVDLTLSYYKSAVLTSNKTLNELEGYTLQSALLEKIKNSPSHIEKKLSEETQILKMLEYLQKKSESNIKREHEMPEKELAIYRKAYAHWVLNNFEKPNFT